MSDFDKYPQTTQQPEADSAPDSLIRRAASAVIRAAASVTEALSSHGYPYDTTGKPADYRQIDREA